jgi:hypothetical protein
MGARRHTWVAGAVGDWLVRLTVVAWRHGVMQKHAEEVNTSEWNAAMLENVGGSDTNAT